MSRIEVTTVNRHAARKLLTEAGVRPEMARNMSLKQLSEHLNNFVGLGTLNEAKVNAALAAVSAENEANGIPNAGKPWDAAQDRELKEHWRRGMDAKTMASIRGRTLGAINSRLQLLGILKYDTTAGKYEETALGRALRAGESDWENNATRAGEFASAEQMQAMQDAHNAAEAVKAADAKGAGDDNAQDEQTASTGNEARNGLDEGARSAIASLAKKVQDLGNTVNGTSARIAQLQQDIADTIAAEVKKVQGAWQKFEIKTERHEFKTEGLAHKAFPKLLRAVSARTRHDGGALNIWLYGPAGTGKSTAARKLAEAFSLAFHTNGPVGSQWDIRGFTDAQGRVVDTAFRRAWENGGVYCWDEGDGSAPAALIEANGALATGFASFPDKVVQRHKDCIVIINGNLRPGAAPDATYNGRYKQDTAFVNRFVAIEWGIDEEIGRAHV